MHSRDDFLLFVMLAAAMTIAPVLTAMIVRLPISSGMLAAAEMGVPSAIAALGLATDVLRAGQAAAIVGAAAVSLAVATVGALRIGASASINRRAPDDAG